jgi:hypothetical protein
MTCAAADHHVGSRHCGVLEASNESDTSGQSFRDRKCSSTIQGEFVDVDTDTDPRRREGHRLHQQLAPSAADVGEDCRLIDSEPVRQALGTIT